MVCIASMGVLIDKYEASKGAGNKALSVKNAGAWSAVALNDASAACQTAGKRLCSKAEWQAACSGPSGLAYPYGSTYQPLSCAGYEYFDNQGCTNYAWCSEKTGAASSCEGGYPGLFDMSGNKQEWTSTCWQDGGFTKCWVAGGCAASGPTELKCNSAIEKVASSTETSMQLGFRCCLTPQ